VSDKLEARHPHIFGDDTSGLSQTERWETIKAEERAASGAISALEGVAAALPALMRAEKLQKRAARVGFDWPDPAGAEDKVREEMAELDEAIGEARTEEAGDLLFAAVNLVRLNGIAPEEALRRANAKFERRFRAMEALASLRGQDFAALDLDAQEALWQAVKASERGEPS
jgi:nucleoside triphosphate diphosphatase